MQEDAFGLGHAFGRQSVEIRSLSEWLAINAETVIAALVGVNEKSIR